MRKRVVATNETPRPGRGRPRDGALDERILEQVLLLLGAYGYSRLTLDELAARSGVANTTILRRWPSKAAVAVAGVERLAPQSVDVPNSGTLRGDMHALLQSADDTFARSRGQFVPRLLREAGHHPEIANLLDTVLPTRRQAYRKYWHSPSRAASSPRRSIKTCSSTCSPGPFGCGC